MLSLVSLALQLLSLSGSVIVISSLQDDSLGQGIVLAGRNGLNATLPHNYSPGVRLPGVPLTAAPKLHGRINATLPRCGLPLTAPKHSSALSRTLSGHTESLLLLQLKLAANSEVRPTPIRVLQIGCNLGVRVLLGMRALSDGSTLMPQILKRYVEFVNTKVLRQAENQGGEINPHRAAAMQVGLEDLEGGAEILEKYAGRTNAENIDGMEPEGICVEPLPSNTRFVNAFLEKVNAASPPHGRRSSKKNLKLSVLRAAISDEKSTGNWYQWPNSSRFEGEQALHLGSCRDFRGTSKYALERYESCARASHNRVPTYSGADLMRRLGRMGMLGRDHFSKENFSVDLLRIDTEGNDPAVLQSLRTSELLKKTVRFLVFEKHVKGAWEATTLEKETRLLWEEAGFRCYFADVAPPTPWGGRPDLKVWALSPSRCWRADYEGTKLVASVEDIFCVNSRDAEWSGVMEELLLGRREAGG